MSETKIRLGHGDTDKTVLSISSEGQVTLGQNVTWDEAAECLLEALEKATGRRVERAGRTTSALKTGDSNG